jgi:DNA modification methylase
MSYPYKNPSKADSIADYQKLVDFDASVIGHSRVGILACDYIFERFRSKVSYDNRKSKSDAWKDPQIRSKMIEYAMRWNSKTEAELTKANIRAALDFNFGSVANFRPAVAKYVYKRFKANSVLDPSSGWGNRMLTAMSMDIDYIGVDSNTKLRPGYKKMFSTFKSKSNVDIITAKSQDVDYYKYSYDLIFTSPPYFDIERYDGMGYVDKETFLDDYFIPTFSNAYQSLNPGGHIAINCPQEMIKHLSFIGKFKKIKMPIANRNGGGHDAHELIYWLKK